MVYKKIILSALVSLALAGVAITPRQAAAQSVSVAWKVPKTDIYGVRLGMTGRGSYVPSGSITSVPTNAQRSIRWCQSRPFRANRDAMVRQRRSKESMMNLRRLTAILECTAECRKKLKRSRPEKSIEISRLTWDQMVAISWRILWRWVAGLALIAMLLEFTFTVGSLNYNYMNSWLAVPRVFFGAACNVIWLFLCLRMALREPYKKFRLVMTSGMRESFEQEIANKKVEMTFGRVFSVFFFMGWRLLFCIIGFGIVQSEILTIKHNIYGIYVIDIIMALSMFMLMNIFVRSSIKKQYRKFHFALEIGLYGSARQLNWEKFLLFLGILYQFAVLGTKYYVEFMLREPRWMVSGHVSRPEDLFLGFWVFLIAGLIPIIWLAIRRFDSRRTFGPLVLWIILSPVVIFVDYLTSAKGPFG